MRSRSCTPTTMMPMLSMDAVPGDRGREFRDDDWQTGLRIFSPTPESGRACKLARYGDGIEGGDARVTSLTEIATPDDGRNPLDVVGADIFQSHILTLLDSRSLARSAAVCSQWRPFALADNLWQPLVVAFCAQRAHLPLGLTARDFTTRGTSSSMKQHLLYATVMTGSLQETLIPAEMCGRTWEVRLKPICGPYWLGLDPTQVGKPGLNRYFSCDGEVSSDAGDPIWGGHACVWEFVRPPDSPTELVRINHWPPLTPRRLKDGRWVLENFYGLYITRPDNPAFASGHCDQAASERRPSCKHSCTPQIHGFQI